MITELDLAKKVLDKRELALYEYVTQKRDRSKGMPSARELSKIIGMPIDNLDAISESINNKMDTAIDMGRRKGDPEISETYKVKDVPEYDDVMYFLIREKNFGAGNIPSRCRKTIDGGTDLKPQGYYYVPLMEFRAFEGTNLENALKEYKANKQAP